MVKQRSLLLFEQALRTEATKKTYFYHLKVFKKFYHLKDYDSILTIEPKKLQVMLEDFLIAQKKRVAPTSIRSIFNALDLFFSMNDVTLNFKKLRKMFPAPEKLGGGEAYSNEDVKKLLDIIKIKKHRAVIHFLCASGVRIGALPDLRLKHLKYMPHGCKAVTVYPDSKDEYITFLTPEASNILQDYFVERQNNGESLSPDSPVFRKDNLKVVLTKAEPISDRGFVVMVYRLVEQSDIKRVKTTKGRFSIPSAHGFRKRFNTILKSNNKINPNLAEKLMGHSTTITLDNNYLKPTVGRLFEEYVKAIPELCIDESYRLKIENETKDKRISELETKDQEIEKLKTRFDSVEKLLERVSKGSN